MDFAELAALASGHAEARAIQTALKLGIFDILAPVPLDDTALAAAISANRRATALIANAMVALELLDKRAGRYSLTDTSRRYLLRSSAEYLGGLILFDESIFETWAHLEQTIRTGAPARTPDMFQSRPEETERFIRAMDSLTRARGDPAYVAQRLDLSRVSRFADIGGGPGTYAVAMLHRWPHLRAAIYDLPATLEVARRILTEREPAALERIDLVRVDYLYDEIPGPCGALFMSNIIHNENETANAELFRKCFRALEPGGLDDHQGSHHECRPHGAAAWRNFRPLPTADHAWARLFVRRSLPMASRRRLRRYQPRRAAKPSVHFLDGHCAQALNRQNSGSVKLFIARRIARAAILIALAAACSGCALGAVGMVSTVAPAVAAGSAQLIGSQVAMKQADGTGATKEDNADQCDQLLRVPPGVEEVRKTKDGVIESRQWKIGGDSGAPAWVMINSNGVSDESWSPKPGITRLFFNPPLYQMLKPDDPEYLAYAPADVINVSDSEQFDSMTGAFGAGVGTFQWHDRSYSYVLVKELPCFKSEKEK